MLLTIFEVLIVVVTNIAVSHTNAMTNIAVSHTNAMNFVVCNNCVCTNVVESCMQSTNIHNL